MPGTRLNFNRTDKDAMKLFFTNRNKGKFPYLKLADNWKSSYAISKELGESGTRTKKRLEKLASFGFFSHTVVEFGKRVDHYWYPTHEGVYCILQTLDKPDLQNFLRSNVGNVKEFSKIEELVNKNDPRVRYLISQLSEIIENKQYYLVSYLIQNWFENTFEGVHGKVFFRRPDYKETLKKVYGKDKMKIISMENF